MRFNIQYKLTLTIAITVAIILSGVYLFLNKNLKEHTYQRIRLNLSKEVALAKSYLENELTRVTNIHNIDKIADSIGRDLNVRATVIDYNGNVIGDSELNDEELKEVESHLYRPEVQDALKSGVGESRRFSTTIQVDMLYMAYPFKTEKTHGVIRLSIPLSDVKEVSDNLKQLLTYGLLFAFILAVVLGFVVSFFVSKPIKDISKIAKGIADGDYSKRIALSTNDEIEELGETINHMSEQIESTIDEVNAGKRRFEAILLSMFEGVMVIDERGMIQLMNGTLRKLLNIEEDPVGRRPLEIIRNIDIQDMVDNVIKKAKEVESKEIIIHMPEEKILQVHVTPVVRNDKIDGAVLVFHDITDLRRMEHVQRDFIANVSHEIRTPVTNIKGFAETLLDGALDDKNNAQEFLNIISVDSERLSKLVDDLLDLSKIESGNLKLTFEPCDINAIVDRVITGLKKQAKKKNITIIKEIPENISKINADENSIVQVFLNLIDNAIKYSNSGDSIKISMSQKDDHVIVNVTDTGMGIPSADLPRIFERFYRVDKARSRELGGTGLGLSIVKHIVQTHHGEITVSSELDKGTTFTFTLPKA